MGGCVWRGLLEEAAEMARGPVCRVCSPGGERFLEVVPGALVVEGIANASSRSMLPSSRRVVVAP